MIKFGLIGFGNIGKLHANNLVGNKIEGAHLFAVSDSFGIDESLTGDAKYYKNYRELLEDGEVDAVIIATPSNLHANLAKEVLQAGKNVLVEKPVSLEVQEARDLLAVSQETKKKVGVVLNQRTDPYYARIKELVVKGDIGELRRISWTMTNWFRPEIYFQSSSWRGTWKGEGGGALMNQCIHNIDIFSWIFGLPRSVKAESSFGKYHNIEVEDEVTAFFEFDSGMKATFLGSTGEYPGVNRLEVVGDKGTIIAEDRVLKITLLEESVDAFSKSTEDMFGTPESKTHLESFVDDKGSQHAGILQNFVESLTKDVDLIGSLTDASKSVELANAILMSSWKNSEVLMPLDGYAYNEELSERKKNSVARQTVSVKKPVDMTKSFR